MNIVYQHEIKNRKKKKRKKAPVVFHPNLNALSRFMSNKIAQSKSDSFEGL